ncbi:MAG: dephospho-CoA kinase [Clostridia bacterium]|nr:dephospho-CoA kinase [Clostridia bacterium]
MIVLGLTGQSGTGKSTIAAMLAAKGAACIDMDKVARELVQVGSSVLREIEREFGPEFIRADGSLDRRSLGRLVFSNSRNLAALNRITHPELVRRTRAWLDHLSSEPSPPEVAVIDAAVLFESGLFELADLVAVVVANADVQASRIAARDGIPLADALARVHAQRPMEEMLARADCVIRTDCPLDATARQVDDMWARLVARV